MQRAVWWCQCHCSRRLFPASTSKAKKKDERLYRDNALYPTDHWQDFLQVELTDIMRQRDDVPFARALNLLRTRTLEEPLANETFDIVNECIREGPEDVLHVYSTNTG